MRIDFKYNWLIFALIFCASLHTTRSQAVEFHYQGTLQVDGSPANGLFDFIVGVYDGESTGLLWQTIAVSDVFVEDGLIDTPLDIDALFIDENDLWLEFWVKPDSAMAYSMLLPRQRVAKVPVAVHALSVDAGGGQWLVDGNNLAYDAGSVVIGAASAQTDSLLQVEASGTASALRVRLDGQTKLRVHGNGGTSFGVNGTPPDNGLLVQGGIRHATGSHGAAKAGLQFVCGNASSDIEWSFNNVNDSAVTVTSNLPEDGRCEVALPFALTGHYFLAHAVNSNFIRSVNCGVSSDGGGNEILVCNGFNPSTGARVDVVVNLLIY